MQHGSQNTRVLGNAASLNIVADLMQRLSRPVSTAWVQVTRSRLVKKPAQPLVFCHERWRSWSTRHHANISPLGTRHAADEKMKARTAWLEKGGRVDFIRRANLHVEGSLHTDFNQVMLIGIPGCLSKRKGMTQTIAHAIASTRKSGAI
jgi:hypothetical protein